jgi:phospholipid/cholesterol/gamma-HCH transport system substrate-binding protein
METRANYVAVGAFVLACILGLVVTLLWLAGSQYRQESATYQTYFTGAVTGLGKGTAVRYSGIEVGRVTALDFDPDNPKQVVATLQVRSDLSVREDAVASIESQGLTGAAYVEITGGKADAPILAAKDSQRYPVIKSKPSSLEQLFQNTPELLAKVSVISDRVADLLNDQNRAAISGMLTNLDDLTSALDKHSADIDQILANLAVATQELDTAMADLHQVLGKAGVTTDKANQTLTAAEQAARQLGTLAADLDDVIKGSKPQLAQFTGEGLPQLTQLLAEARTLVTSLTHLSNELGHEPTKLLFGDRHEGYAPK